ncbi:MAG: hypothetical protein ACOC7U_09120 [Spirochaetota bacterium]
MTETIRTRKKHTINSINLILGGTAKRSLRYFFIVFFAITIFIYLGAGIEVFAGGTAPQEESKEKPPSAPDQESLESILNRSQFSDAQKQSVVLLFNRAADKHIPPEMLLPRLQEGLAKNLPYQKLLEALENYIHRLEESRNILKQVDGGEKLVQNRASWARTAHLLAGEITEEEIKKVAAASSHRWKDYREATYLFASLTKWGLSSKKALDLTTEVLHSPLKGGEFTGVVDVLIKGRQLKINPEELAERIIDQVPKVQTPEELEEKVLY